MRWRYEFVATRHGTGEEILISRYFLAVDIYDARKVLAAVLSTKKVHRSPQADVIRLIDPDGDEVWHARLGPQRR